MKRRIVIGAALWLSAGALAGLALAAGAPGDGSTGGVFQPARAGEGRPGGGAAGQPSRRDPGAAKPVEDRPGAAAEQARQGELLARLKGLRYRIVYESFRGDNWELLSTGVDPDGGKPVNLTNTPDSDELYPHISPDGKRICFVADEGKGEARSRNVYYMNADGTGRTLVARNGREPCWGPEGERIAYLRGEFDKFTTKDFATKGLVIHDLKTGRHQDHPNAELHHLYNICWSPCGRWFLATVHGGMGHKHANLAIEADGKGVFKLDNVGGCRPDISPDGAKLCWNLSDQAICAAELDLKSSPPRVSNIRHVVTCDKEHEVYHSDWSPDGRLICFSYGPSGAEQMGVVAKDWHICVASAEGQGRGQGQVQGQVQKDPWVVLTRDGVSNKEPDWAPAPR